MSNAKRKSTYFKLPIAKNTKTQSSSSKTPYQRHLEILEFLPKLKVQEPCKISEIELLKRNHLFLREEDSKNWEERLAQKYYDQLFKEYCLSNLSRYKTGQIALRWRTREEVMVGKGQFTCGNLECLKTVELASYEVNFGYLEQGIKKNALVKLRLCQDCGYKLNYKKRHSKSKRIIEEKSLVLENKDIEAVQENVETVQELEKEEKSQDLESHFWAQNSKKNDLELSKEEEFDQYFADLLQ